MKSSRFLPAIVPVLAGLLVPTIAFAARLAGNRWFSVLPPRMDPSRG
jgi:hypothetical protein